MSRDRQLSHIYLHLTPETLKYSRSGGGGKKKPFERPNADVHAPVLNRQLASLRAYFAKLRQGRAAHTLHSVNEGLISVDFDPRGLEKIQSLEDRRRAVEIAVVQSTPESEGRATAVLRLGQGEFKALERKVADYTDPSKLSPTGRRRHEDLLGAVLELRPVTLVDLWSSEPELLSVSGDRYWEIWLARETKLTWLTDAAKRFGLKVFSDRVLNFPDRTVVLGFGSNHAMEQVINLLGHILELRKPSLVKDFVALDPVDQLDWVRQLKVRPPEANACPVCLLDDGIDHEHPLLKDVVVPDRVLTYLPA